MPSSAQSEALITAGAAVAVVSAMYAKYGLKFIIDFCTGGVAGAIAKTLTAPIENCKRTLQCQEINPDVKAGVVKRYTGIVDFFKRTSREKGVLALFEGNMANVLRYFPTQFLNFMMKDKIKRLTPKYNPKTQFWKFFAGNMVSGGVAGAISLSVVYPLDYVRNVQMDDLAGRYKGKTFLEVGSMIVRKRGVLALYSGFGVSVLGIVLYRGPYFGLFDSLKNANPWMKDKGFMGFASKFVIAQTTALFAGFITYPLDTVRRRQQMDAVFTRDGDEPLYKGNWDCVVRILKDEGVLAFFQGFDMNVLRTIAGALILVGYDVFVKGKVAPLIAKALAAPKKD